MTLKPQAVTQVCESVFVDLAVQLHQGLLTLKMSDALCFKRL